MTIVVRYACQECELEDTRLEVPARGQEDVRIWMDRTVRLVSKDHHRRSPLCQAKTLTHLMIPMTGTDRIGGATVQ